MMPYIWDYRGRVLFALACLVISKLAMVGVITSWAKECGALTLSMPTGS